ncbi:LysR family transcriptional regulator [Staphylococcus pseudoxylosus]|uniref:LysR family transcriptional regulator n=1 Tax=Staphylococcus TaxID=1279 RepID=UPI002DB7C87B|nr:LysR family transcriptional regulator [Staphylococcus pseudoxylosus]MEB7763875.1 LysR family transcriptional regulator [Staphylococcus pseudoxylosus]MEB8087176.1 LysR family transcriptional regulator [Staphylococcus pseudoxylosus]
MKYFQNVANTEHLTKSSENLHVAQPSLSKIIKNLEEELGAKLFDRTGRNIKLNTYGKIFLKHVDQLFYEIEVGVQKIGDLKDRNKGSIFFTASSIDKNFSEVIKNFSKTFPHVNIFIKQERFDCEKINLLLNNKVDFAFVNKEIDNSQITTEVLMKEHVYLAVATNHHLARKKKISINELEEEFFVKLTYDSNSAYLYDELEKLFIPNITCQCDDESSLINLVEQGLGVAFISHNRINNSLLPIKLIEIEEAKDTSFLRLAWKKENYMSKAKEFFYNYIITNINK